MILRQDHRGSAIYVHRQAFRYVEAFLANCLQFDHAWPICLQTSLIGEDHIVYNTEQMTRSQCLQNNLRLLHSTQVKKYWDQSQKNIDILRKHIVDPTIRAKMQQMPLELTFPELQHQQRNAFKDYDLAFVGTVTPRRKALLDQLSKRGLTVCVIQTFGLSDTIRECLSARAILNLHANEDQKIFETARCQIFLEAGVPVITEKSLDDDPRCFVFDPDQDGWLDSVFQKCAELRSMLWRHKEISGLRDLGAVDQSLPNAAVDEPNKPKAKED